MKWTLRQKITLVSLLICILLTIYTLYNRDNLQAKSLPAFAPTHTCHSNCPNRSPNSRHQFSHNTSNNGALSYRQWTS